MNKYGWLRDYPDLRDMAYQAPAPLLAALPQSVDLRLKMPPVYDQGDLGSCVAQAVAGNIDFVDRWKTRPAPLFVYYNSRWIQGTTAWDSGAQIRDGIKAVVHWGYCLEPNWPYDIRRFATPPPRRVYADAIKRRVQIYQRLPQSLEHFKACLAESFPFVFGFTVYSSFESPSVTSTGMVPLPQAGEHVRGGHAVMAVGYDDAKQAFNVRNSWGETWGQQGYCWFPYSYLTNPNLAADFWVIKFVP